MCLVRVWHVCGTCVVRVWSVYVCVWYVSGTCLCLCACSKLREQHRIQIHVHLFTSFILTNVVMILWENLVYNDRLHNPAEDSLMYKDTVGHMLLHN